MPRHQVSILHIRCISEDPSSSDPDSQCKESWLLLVEETLSSRPTTEQTRIRSSSLTQRLRPSHQLRAAINPLTSKAVDHQATSKSGQPMPDGSNSSSMTMAPLSMSRMVELWMLPATRTEITRMSLSSRDTMLSINSGTLSTSILFSQNLRMATTIQLSACIAVKNSQLSQLWAVQDNGMWSVPILLSRPDKWITLKNSNSTARAEPLSVSQPRSPSVSKAAEVQRMSMFGPPQVTGSKSLDSLKICSWMWKAKSLKLRTRKT